jgi:hypothetical protein
MIAMDKDNVAIAAMILLDRRARGSEMVMVGIRG